MFQTEGTASQGPEVKHSSMFQQLQETRGPEMNVSGVRILRWSRSWAQRLGCGLECAEWWDGITETQVSTETQHWVLTTHILPMEIKAQRGQVTSLGHTVGEGRLLLSQCSTQPTHKPTLSCETPTLI